MYVLDGFGEIKVRCGLPRTRMFAHARGDQDRVGTEVVCLGQVRPDLDRRPDGQS